MPGKIKTYSPKKKRRPQIRTLLKKYRAPDGTKVETKPESIMRALLSNMGVRFQAEYPVQHKRHYKVYDFFCYLMDEYCFFLECDGCFWHAKEYYTENKPFSKLHKIQKRNIANDKLKNRIAKERGVPLLRFWEDDIIKNPHKCKQAIENEINRQRLIYSSNVLSHNPIPIQDQ